MHEVNSPAVIYHRCHVRPNTEQQQAIKTLKYSVYFRESRTKSDTEGFTLLSADFRVCSDWLKLACDRSMHRIITCRVFFQMMLCTKHLERRDRLHFVLKWDHLNVFTVWKWAAAGQITTVIGDLPLRAVSITPVGRWHKSPGRQRLVEQTQRLSSWCCWQHHWAHLQVRTLFVPADEVRNVFLFHSD